MGDSTNLGGMCPSGYYCGAGAIAPDPCPVGKYGTVVGASTEAAGCSDCPGGYYCDVKGLNTYRLITLFDSTCWPGYYCTGGATIPYPTDGVTGNICPAGSYCEGGNTAPVLCVAAVYAGISPITGTPPTADTNYD